MICASVPFRWEMVFLCVIYVMLFATNLRVGYILGAWRGRGTVGVYLALFLGPLGWLLTLFLRPDPESPTYHRSLCGW